MERKGSIFSSYFGKKQKYVSQFVLRMQLLSARLKVKKYLWYSIDEKGTPQTYIRKIHGELK